MLKTLTIANLELRSNLLLAPMAGVTDLLYRRTIKSIGGCGLTYSELVSAEGIIRGQARTINMLLHSEPEHPFAIQIYGARPEAMADAARTAVDAGADLVDINVGCPARKVIRNQGGSHLLRDLPRLAAIIDAVRQAITVPLTIKIRSGFDEQGLNFLEVGRMAQDSGVDAITLHPRTRQQMFSGRSEWDHIRQLKAALRIPVIGNGDIFHPPDALAMFRDTGCDAVMVGRGIMKNPWLIRQIHDLLTSGTWREVSPADKLNLCLELVRQVAGEIPEKKMLGEMKKFCSWLVHGYRGAARQRQELYAYRDPVKLLGRLEEIVRQQEFASGE